MLRVAPISVRWVAIGVASVVAIGFFPACAYDVDSYRVEPQRDQTRSSEVLLDGPVREGDAGVDAKPRTSPTPDAGTPDAADNDDEHGAKGKGRK